MVFLWEHPSKKMSSQNANSCYVMVVVTSSPVVVVQSKCQRLHGSLDAGD